MIKRGEIYYIEPSKTLQTTGSEQRANRPGIVVSNDNNNQNSGTIEIVYLTTQPKTVLPTHVEIRSANRTSTALCEQVQTVSVDRLNDLMGTCSDAEMKRIDDALLISLDIGNIQDVKSKVAELEAEINQLKVENGVYKNMMSDTINNLIKKG